MSDISKPIVVGIDGSQQAECAALWAVDEALRRHAVIRLLYVIRTDLTGPLSADEYRVATDTAKKSLRAARAAIARRNPSVVVEASIETGSPAGALIAVSSDADMICVGSSGTGRMSKAILGSTATSVAENAACTVTIVRFRESTGAPEPSLHWIIVPVSRHMGDECAVIADAVAEARYRGWPILAVGTCTRDAGEIPSDRLDRIVEVWHRRFPDVHIYPIACDTGIGHYLRTHPDIAGLAVIDAAHSKDAESIIGTAIHTDRPQLAVLVARHQPDFSPNTIRC